MNDVALPIDERMHLVASTPEAMRRDTDALK